MGCKQIVELDRKLAEQRGKGQVLELSGLTCVGATTINVCYNC